MMSSQQVAMMADMEERRKQRLMGDTYKVRKAEGRPNHTTMSMFVVILGIAAFVVQAFALMMPHWRASWTGVMGYPATRSWGLWYVNGRRSQSHQSISAFTCAYYGQLNIGGVCASPICLWYRVKCSTYIDIMMYSYIIGFVFCVELVVHALCVFWTIKLTPRLLRWASVWWCVVAVSHVSCVSIYFLMTEALFDTLDSHSYYPIPSPSTSCVLTCIAGVFILFDTFMGYQLSVMWPQPGLADDDDTESDEDFDEVLATGPSVLAQAEGYAQQQAQVMSMAQQQGFVQQQGAQQQGFVQQQGLPQYGQVLAPQAHGDAFGLGVPSLAGGAPSAPSMQQPVQIVDRAPGPEVFAGMGGTPQISGDTENFAAPTMPLPLREIDQPGRQHVRGAPIDALPGISMPASLGVSPQTGGGMHAPVDYDSYDKPTMPSR